MSEKRRWNEESRVRGLLAIGIVLSLVAYIVFVGTESDPWLMCSALIACAGLGTSFYGLWSWNSYQKAEWARSRSGQGTTT